MSSIKHLSSLMVVRDLDLVCVPAPPDETYPPLLVYSYAVLPLTGSLRFLQTISGRYSQIVDRFGGVQQHKLSVSGALQFERESSTRQPLKYPLRLNICQRSDHRKLIIAPRVNTVKRYHPFLRSNGAMSCRADIASRLQCIRWRSTHEGTLRGQLDGDVGP